MFTTKKEEFKYENQVKALIREANVELNERIIVLQAENQLLTQELNQIKNGVCIELQRLETRITDFTDIWNPFMAQNMIRIKDDLLNTEREDMKKIQADLESKMVKIVEENNTGLIDNILVGYYDGFSMFTYKDSNNIELSGKFKGFGCNRDRSNCKKASFVLILESLKYLKNANYDPVWFYDYELINKNGKQIKSARNSMIYKTDGWHDDKIKSIEVKNVYKLCKEYDIKFLINGQDTLNGIPIKMLFE